MKISAFDCSCAFDNGQNCVALTEKNCNGCNFRKTTSEIEAGRKRAARRLGSLPPEQQKRIHETYHDKYAQKY